MSVPYKSLRLDGYVRVSGVGGRSGASFISPTVQRERIAAWCSLYDARLQQVFEELDESGGRADRPLLIKAIERVEAGLTDGIIVAKLDRFSRSFKDALEHIERIDRAGGRLISVQDQFDLGTDHGRLVLRLMLSFADFERDRIRTTWDDANRKAVERGVHGASHTPVGYRKRRDGRLRRNPRTAPAITEAFRMRAAGANLGEISRYLRDQKVLSGQGFAWRPGSVRRVLENPVYLGQARFGGHVHPGAHPALTDEVTWRLAQYPPVRRELPPHPGLLYGLLRCASCRSLMRTWTGGGRGVNHAYRCSRTPDQRGPCPHKAWVSASVIEALAEDLLFATARRRPLGNPPGTFRSGRGRARPGRLRAAAGQIPRQRPDRRHPRRRPLRRRARGPRPSSP
jgi:DNA invertase Pin-like site-specific DNA recombinase